jgi:hypothetical protein
MVAGVAPDADGIWSFLQEPADFFDVPMPDLDVLRAALNRFAVATGARDRALIAATITLVEIAALPDFVVTGRAVDRVRATGVRVLGCDAALHGPGNTDPVWLRMAARTTSRGPVDQIRRWLNGAGYADGVPAETCVGAPLLGALVFETAGTLVGIDNPEPTSILDQLEGSGVTNGIRRVDERPAVADRAWWISPEFETHPVVSIDDASYDVAAEPWPPFLEPR